MTCEKHQTRAECDDAIDRLVEAIHRRAVELYPADKTRQLAWSLQVLGWSADHRGERLVITEPDPAGASAPAEYAMETETADEAAADLARAEL